MKNIAIFASGTGSNFEAIFTAIENHELEANLTLLVSDKPNSLAVEKAKRFGIDYLAINPKDYQTKEKYELEILEALKDKSVELIILAGYMRLIGNTLLNSFSKKIINIHPSLLPSFKGIDAVGQAMKANVKVTGVTVHFVDQGMDTGEIIDQEPLIIREFNTRAEIELAIHKIEHVLYPKVIKMILEEEYNEKSFN